MFESLGCNYSTKTIIRIPPFLLRFVLSSSFRLLLTVSEHNTCLLASTLLYFHIVLFILTVPLRQRVCAGSEFSRTSAE